MVGLHPCGHKNSRPPLPKYLPASASVLSSPSLCGSTYPLASKVQGSLAPTNLPLPGPNFLQALPNPAVQLNLPQNPSQHLGLGPTCPLCFWDLLPSFCLLHRAPPASPPRDQEAGSVFGMKD